MVDKRNILLDNGSGGYAHAGEDTLEFCLDDLVFYIDGVRREFAPPPGPKIPDLTLQAIPGTSFNHKHAMGNFGHTHDIKRDQTGGAGNDNHAHDYGGQGTETDISQYAPNPSMDDKSSPDQLAKKAEANANQDEIQKTVNFILEALRNHGIIVP